MRIELNEYWMVGYYMIRTVFIPSQLTRLNNALQRVLVTATREARGNPRRASQKFAINLIQSIASQRWSAGWAPLSSRYAKWKAEHGFSMKTWQMKADLIHSIKSMPFDGELVGSQKRGAAQGSIGKRRTFSYMAGIPSNAIDSGGKNWGLNGPRRRIAWYARMLEYGRPPSGGKFGGAQPARPLFQPEFELFRGRTFHGYLLQSRRIIMGAWK